MHDSLYKKQIICQKTNSISYYRNLLCQNTIRISLQLSSAIMSCTGHEVPWFSFCSQSFTIPCYCSNNMITIVVNSEMK